MRIGLLSDHWGRNVVRDALENLRPRGTYELETIDDFRTVDSMDQAIWSLINLVDVVVASLEKGSANLYYEIGLAHGLGKPVIVVAQEDSPEPPPLLASQRIIRISGRIDTVETLTFRLKQALDEALTRRRPYSGPRSPSASSSSYSSTHPQTNVGDFRSLFAYEGPARGLRFERWFTEMARSVPGWEVIEADRRRGPDAGFDLVIWNSREESELQALGNPIAVEMKAIGGMTAEGLSSFLHRARRSGLKGLLLATTGVNPPRTKRLLARMRSEEGIRAIALDRDDLIGVVSPDDLLSAFRQKARELLYEGEV